MLLQRLFPIALVTLAACSANSASPSSGDSSAAEASDPDGGACAPSSIPSWDGDASVGCSVVVDDACGVGRYKLACMSDGGSSTPSPPAALQCNIDVTSQSGAVELYCCPCR
jgi:hypothetical protein